jgi:YggT family protein
MSLPAALFYWALQAYFLLLIVRFLLDLMLSANPSWRPKGLVLVVAEVTMTLTDPPLKLIRRIIPPIRLGAFSIDLGWTILVSAILFAQRLVLVLL